jgi:Mn-containing catalase
LEDSKSEELAEAEEMNAQLSEERSTEVIDAEPKGTAQWSDYSETTK